jgi:hypothetical protein
MLFLSDVLLLIKDADVRQWHEHIDLPAGKSSGKALCYELCPRVGLDIYHYVRFMSA